MFHATDTALRQSRNETHGRLRGSTSVQVCDDHSCQSECNETTRTHMEYQDAITDTNT